MTSVWVLPVKPSMNLRYLIKAAGDLPPGGHWVTINGGHVYIVRGKPWYPPENFKVKLKHDIMTRQNAQRFGKKSRQLNPTNAEKLTRYFERGQGLVEKSRKYHAVRADLDLETEKNLLKNSKRVKAYIQNALHSTNDIGMNLVASIASQWCIIPDRFQKQTGHKLSNIEIILIGFKNGWADNVVKNPLSAILQYGAEDIFGSSNGLHIEPHDIRKILSDHDRTYELGKITDKEMDQILEFGKICAHAFYEDTQQWLKNKNISQLYLTRGMIFNYPPEHLKKYFDGIPKKVKLDGWPLASFTLDPKQSAVFATHLWDITPEKSQGRHQSHMMIGSLVPREKIFSMAIHGLGSWQEKEVITTGNDINGTAIGWNSNEYLLTIGVKNQTVKEWLKEPDDAYGKLWAAINQTAEGHMDPSKFSDKFLTRSSGVIADPKVLRWEKIMQEAQLELEKEWKNYG